MCNVCYLDSDAMQYAVDVDYVKHMFYAAHTAIDDLMSATSNDDLLVAMIEKATRIIEWLCKFVAVCENKSECECLDKAMMLIDNEYAAAEYVDAHVRNTY